MTPEPPVSASSLAVTPATSVAGVPATEAGRQLLAQFAPHLPYTHEVGRAAILAIEAEARAAQQAPSTEVEGATNEPSGLMEDRVAALEGALARFVEAAEHTHKMGRVTAALDASMFEARALLAPPAPASTNPKGSVVAPATVAALVTAAKNVCDSANDVLKGATEERLARLDRATDTLGAVLDRWPAPARDIDPNRLRCGQCGDELLPDELIGHLYAEGRTITDHESATDELAWATRVLHRYGITSPERCDELAASVGMLPLDHSAPARNTNPGDTEP